MLPRDVDVILHAVRVSSLSRIRRGRCGNMVMNPRTKDIGKGLDPDEGLSSTQILVVKPSHFSYNFQRRLEGPSWSHGMICDLRTQA